MGRWCRTGLIVAIVIGLVVGMLWALQRRLIYFPDRAAPPVPAAVTEVALATDDGLRLTAWRIAPEAPSEPGIAALVAPGNAGNRADRVPLARQLAAAGLTVLLLDYRGYGGNPGEPSEDGLARDARAAWSYLTGAGGFAADRIVLFGESLGAAVVTRLAAGLSEQPRGLVLRSPFASLTDVGKAHYPFLPVGWLLRDRFSVVDHIRTVEAPTIVVHGTRDLVVPPEQSREVAEAAANLVDVVAVEGADHNDAVLGEGTVVVDAVRRLT
ncbi:alpha/beta hydrolase [Cryptosporangium minutisporangium]|uniref:Alpha/beta hydrolase n=1 Tax=Cryptosporangium minutisporangium TaxID=113569 RepID=A0ABP6ST12_9ACTN